MSGSSKPHRLPQAENSIPDTALSVLRLEHQESSSVQLAVSQASRYYNQARNVSHGKASGTAEKRQIIQYQEHTRLSGVSVLESTKTATGSSTETVDPRSYRRQGSSSRSDRTESQAQAPLHPPELGHSSASAVTTKSGTNPNAGNAPTVKVPRRSEEPDMYQFPGWGVKIYESLTSCIQQSLEKYNEDALVVLRWLSGNFKPEDLDSPSSVSKPRSTQRLEFHHIEVLQGLKAANWIDIAESSRVAMELWEECIDSELDTLRKDNRERPVLYENQPRNIRLIQKFWCLFILLLKLPETLQEIYQACQEQGVPSCFVAGDVRLEQNRLSRSTTKYPGSALPFVGITVFLLALDLYEKDFKAAKKTCSELFDGICVLETHEKEFSSQMKIAADLIMVGIHQKVGEKVEARFYISQIRKVKNAKDLVWYKWVEIVFGEALDLQIE
ncbi:hypothetical protein TWF481_012044 [Arthrobotrys musiformis]|uniref:NWD NACHT-NTPase N-terminal domain-containing protein n=1 Tax=Arthrobotrys musiformis TaxID=47236 RepID=A0AAV9W1Z6_9PEZI